MNISFNHAMAIFAHLTHEHTTAQPKFQSTKTVGKSNIHLFIEEETVWWFSIFCKNALCSRRTRTEGNISPA